MVRRAERAREPHSGARALCATYHVEGGLVVGSASDGGGRDEPAARALSFEEARDYLDAAWAPGTADGLVYAHRWAVGDVILWTNRLVWHSATSTRHYTGESRVHHRIRMRAGDGFGVRACDPTTAAWLEAHAGEPCV